MDLVVNCSMGRVIEVDVQVLSEWGGLAGVSAGLVNAITRELHRFSMIDWYWAECFLEFNDFVFLFFSF